MLDQMQVTITPTFSVAIDLGVTNLAAITSNRVGFIPRLVNGRPLKTWNQWYNKRMKELKQCLPKADEADYEQTEPSSQSLLACS